MPPVPLLRIGYVALMDAAPLLVAEEPGLLARQGVRVSLSEEGAWAAVRDEVALGALGGAHLLGPMPIALACGLGGVSARLSVGAGVCRDGNAVALFRALADEAGLNGQGGALAPDAFVAALGARAAAKRPPVRLAAVLPLSLRNHLLRHWLALGGCDPDRDLVPTVVPPARAARALVNGEADGFCAGEPWGSHAAAIGAGRVALATSDIWPDHPADALAPYGDAIRRAAAPLVGEYEPDPVTLPKEIAA